MPSNEEITARVEARTMADECHQLAIEESIRFPDDVALAFWQRMLANVLERLPRNTHPIRIVERGPLAAMTDEEAKAFGSEVVPFGKWASWRVDSCPMDWLDWLDAQPDFRRQVNRYLRSERVQREQRTEASA